MNNNQGSIWQKWDFHVHTPYSLLRNGYGKDPFQCSEDDLESLFDEYVTNLFTKAVEKDIVAIGITDYFMLEGYKKIKEDYLSKPEKMIELFPDESVRKKIEKIYIFPNVELRLDTFVVKDQERNSINYHVIFSGDIPTKDIEDNFLHRIEFEYDSGDKRPLTLANIEQMGAMVKTNERRTGTDIFVGLNHITVNHSQIGQLLQTNDKFAANSFIAVPVDEDLSDIPWSGRDYATRKNIYKQSHFLMTSFPKTIDWGVARNVPSDRQKQEIESRIREFGSLKPCLWGSDAHSYTEMFNPSENRFCWVKADNTFEGLRQVVYEPADRIFIGSEPPDLKDPHYVIKSIKFEDEKFQPEEIVFNPNLNCIIGGKSTGKSLLLRQIAKRVNPNHVNEREQSIERINGMDVNAATVLWGDGVESEKEIVYIPQSFLNRAIDGDARSPIKNIIESFILQNEKVSIADNERKKEIEAIKKDVRENVLNYCSCLNDLRDKKQELLMMGASKSFQSSIAEIQSKRNELAETFKIDEVLYKKYEILRKEIEECSSKNDKIKDAMDSIWSIPDPVVEIPDTFRYECTGQEFVGETVQNTYDYTCPPEFSLYAKDIREKLHELLAEVNTKWSEFLSALYDKMNQEYKTVSLLLDTKQQEFKPLKDCVEKNEEFEKLGNQMSRERTKLKQALDIEKSISELIEKRDSLKQELVASQQKYENILKKYCDVVNEISTSNHADFIFSAKLIWKRNLFLEFIDRSFNNKNFSRFKDQTGFDLRNISDDQYQESFLKQIVNYMTNDEISASLPLKSSNILENTLISLFDNWYDVYYEVASGNDTLEYMSPGKRASILLELLISLSESKCPILIDQPEDDLDNRSIYKDLADYLKRKKKERQIIIVTHNANLVVGADAEEVIIANQDGADSKNDSYQFEYRTGSIENNTIISEKQGVLYKSGIQSQICDILEGGKTAFEHRKNKYLSIAD